MESDNRFWFRIGPDVVWQHVGAAGAVFDPATGETFFLNELPALILSAVDSVPASFSQLVDRLGGQDGIDEAVQTQIFSALTYLESAALLESQASSTT